MRLTSDAGGAGKKTRWTGRAPFLADVAGRGDADVVMTSAVAPVPMAIPAHTDKRSVGRVLDMMKFISTGERLFLTGQSRGVRGEMPPNDRAKQVYRRESLTTRGGMQRAMSIKISRGFVSSCYSATTTTSLPAVAYLLAWPLDC